METGSILERLMSSVMTELSDKRRVHTLGVRDTALGAGGMSKVFFPQENRLERVPNVNNYEVYIERLQEMFDRKEQGIFQMMPEIYKQTEALKRR